MYPEKPLCHKINPVFKLGSEIAWDVRRETGLRHCTYCGSLHPEDLVAVLSQGAKLESADWKYGWPHKYYIEKVKNPLVGQEVNVGGRSYINEQGERQYDPHMAIAGEYVGCAVKFYNEHLWDLKDQPEFEIVAAAIQENIGTVWVMTEHGLKYRVVHHG